MIISHDTLHIGISLICVITIIFSGMIPWQLSLYMDSLIGRIISVVVIMLTVKYFGIFNGLLVTLVVLLVISNSPRLGGASIRGSLWQDEQKSKSIIDGFADLQKRKTQGPRWFVERVLGENPMKIITDRTQTDAVQDLSERSMGTR